MKEKEKKGEKRNKERSEKKGLSQSGRNWFLFAGFRPFDNPVVDAPGRSLVQRLSQPSEAEQRLHMRIPLLEREREKRKRKKSAVA